MSAQYKVAWRRDAWSETTKTKSKTFARRADAQRFVDKLDGDGRGGLSPTAVSVHARQVGRWSEVTL